MTTAPLETPRTCPRCGRTIPSDQSECSCITRPRRLWLHSRETILLLTFLGLILAFIVAGSVSRLYHLRRRSLAAQWSAQGSADLQAGNASKAVADFETALIYAREDVSDEQMQVYELNLAEALTAAGRNEQAISYLLDLREKEPARGQLNLELATLAAKQGDDANAKGYYDSAINGLWEGNAVQVANSRRAARLALYQYLTQRGENAAAQSVLLAIAAALPADAALHLKIGQVFVGTGETQLALDQFREAVRLDPHNTDALVGAGTAAFDLGDDRDAVRYFEQALRDQPSDNPASGNLPSGNPELQHSLAVARAASDLDPYEAGLNPAAKAARAASSYQSALTRLTQCASSQGLSLLPVGKTTSATPPGGSIASAAQSQTASGSQNPDSDKMDLQKLYVQAQGMHAYALGSVLERYPNQIGPLMSLVFAIENATTNRCGPSTRAEDEALSHIAKREAATPASAAGPN